MFSYYAYNLAIRSEIELPQLLPGGSEADVVVRLNGYDPMVGPPQEMARAYHVTPKFATLDYAGLGTLTVREGREIAITLLPDADTSLLPLYLTGTALAVLLYQRGLLVLRASAVAMGGRGVIFMASSGGGKSALAATLHRRGHQLLAEDVTAIDMRAQCPVVIPAYPALLLDPDTSAAVGGEAATLRPIHPMMQKGLRIVERGFADTPVPLRMAYYLHPGADNNIGYVPLQIGLAAVMHQSYPNCLLQPAGIEYLRLCSRLVGAVPVCELTRRCALEDLPELVQMVETHVSTQCTSRDSQRSA